MSAVRSNDETVIDELREFIIVHCTSQLGLIEKEINSNPVHIQQHVTFFCSYPVGNILHMDNHSNSCKKCKGLLH